ncbi:nitrate- and nitrite sensing domain-containing protein [Nonomuraea sp. NPDC050328]|uniref:sensor histidine kinase n=1 Tax=Nonomuraea sp. NPDC050328 TaxID=3364361 RepID=UPI0037B93904
MALILIPTVVGVLLAAIQLTDAISTSSEYRRLTQVAELVRRLGGLSHELGKERTLTAWFVADKRPTGHLTRLKEQRVKVDTLRGQVLKATEVIDGGHQPRVRHAVEEMRRWLNGLPALRDSIVGESAPPRAAIRTYTSLIEVLRALQGEMVTVGDDRLVADGSAFAALHRAKEEVARQQVILTVALAENRLDYDDLSDFLGSWDRQQAELDRFTAEAAPAEALLYRKTVRGQTVDRADAMRQRALAQLREYRTIRDLDISTRRDLNVWYASTGVTVDLTRKVEDALAAKLVSRSQELQDAEQRNAIISGAVILVLLILVLVITTWVAGSLVRPLRRLRAEALEIAGFRLPETVRALRESGESTLPQVASVGVTTRDEIGEVARAFDEVHREAIRLAGDEAKLRANVNSMFVNLARRSQTLVERQLDLIEELEHGEEDESRLSSLFRLDHMATRMRRNSENLLVLAGQETARKWSEPVPLVDVARASLSEVENYERVAIQIPSDLEIVGPAVTDTVHLLAELIENAISFSPRETKVVVTSAPVAGGGVLLSVTDLGIGMSAEEMGEANWRLTNPPIVDVAVARRMGLFVVGRLALRHGIQVQLRPREGGPGLTAMVLLPAVLIVPASAPTQQIPAYAGAGQGSTGGATPAGPNPYGQPQALVPYGEQPPAGFDSARYEQQAPATGFDGPMFGDRGAFGDDRSAGSGSAGLGVMDTPWPTHLPPPGGGDSWPSAAEEPQEVYEQPDFQRERPSRLADEPAASWPSFAETAREPYAEPYADQAGREPYAESFAESFAEADGTGPLPVIRESVLDDRGEEAHLPIFSAVSTSDWFTKPEILTRPAEQRAEQRQDGPGLPQRGADSFGSTGDFGSLGASAGDFGAPAGDGGLPQRRPGATEPPVDSSLPQRSPFGESAYGEPASGAFAGGGSAAGGSMFGDAGQGGGLPRRQPAGGGFGDADPFGYGDQSQGQSGQGHFGQSQSQSQSQSGQGGLPQRQPSSGNSLLRGGPSEPSTGGTTSTGLPRRVPKANLVSGSVQSSGSLFGEPAEPVSPDRLRSRLSSFQQGVRQGREEIGEE